MVHILVCADYAFFPAYYAMFQFFSNLPIMLSVFPIMLCGFTHYAHKKDTFFHVLRCFMAFFTRDTQTNK